RLGGPARGRAPARAGDEQAAVEPRLHGRDGRGARRRGNGPDREHRDRGHQGGVSGIFPQTDSQVHWSLARWKVGALQLHAQRAAIPDTTSARGPPRYMSHAVRVALLVCLCFPAAASAATLSFSFSGSIETVTDSDHFLDSSVAPNGLVSGTYDVDLA